MNEYLSRLFIEKGTLYKLEFSRFFKKMATLEGRIIVNFSIHESAVVTEPSSYGQPSNYIACIYVFIISSIAID